MRTKQVISLFRITFLINNDKEKEESTAKLTPINTMLRYNEYKERTYFVFALCMIETKSHKT